MNEKNLRELKKTAERSVTVSREGVKRLLAREIVEVLMLDKEAREEVLTAARNYRITEETYKM